jgi:uncharacterized protein
MIPSGSTLVDVMVPLESSEDEAALRLAVARKLAISPARIKELRLRKHSLDARQSQIKVQLRFEVGVDEPLLPDPPLVACYPEVKTSAKRALIVGSGPAGMFAALQCLKRGWKPIVLERGKEASARRFDLGPIMRKGIVDPDSNYCFGEGGAGTFSDGKLYTRATKRGSIQDIYETLVAHGAPARILVDAHPHIGSNLLPNVVKSIRQSILAAGGEVRFQSKVTGLTLRQGRIQTLIINDVEEIAGEVVILATGHSARDIYQLLHNHQILLEPKAFAVGVRIEHPQSLIDSLQYHFPRETRRHNLLPAASYRLATKIRGRGVHSFCMCPGGFIVPASTEPGLLVVNGMSLSKRDSPFANSGLVVTVEPEDLKPYLEKHGPLGGIYFQAGLEQQAQGQRDSQVAPAQLVTDFLKKRESTALPETSYHRGIAPARIDELFDRGIVERLTEGLQLFGRQMKGYITPESVLIGVESRTSSPVRIPRDAVTLRHPQIENLFPCGEGAGFAGGIVSAALDGIRCAEALESS